MSTPLVSVIIPVYNAEKYIAEAIISSKLQTWPNMEIIIVDDGSKDNSLTVAKTFESNNVKIFHQENKGASAARNRGLREAKGDYIQFLDADDLLSSNKVEEQLKLLKSFPDHVCSSSTVYFFDTEDKMAQPVISPTFSSTAFQPVDYLIKLYGVELGGMATLHSWLTPRKVVDKAGAWDESLSVDDDGEYFCRIILNSKGIVNCKEAVNYYRKYKSNNNLSAQLSLTAYQSMLKSLTLKHRHLLATDADAFVVNKIFSRIYGRTAMAAFPQYAKLSRMALKKAKELGLPALKYEAGPISTPMSKIVGWRIVRLLTYIRYRV